ncbi:MAG: L,D-transpeptidase [Alphaproteobacteria bacterium]|nr:L,D-transpeptidase [Alphaproteobacteria bacterium]MBU1561643.1 L,D-transpeptidase [Alphaproteobacteria bacterium]MBU2302376.1 L,D-transpeptidase [Alphaproteobacteria bacterium]MBU2368656.1 L,D-transpeptidase [Alphaproteobacteria bacterium]
MAITKRLLTCLAFLAMLGAAAPARAEATLVGVAADMVAGTIVVRTAERALYLVLQDGQALRYSVGVGRADRQWIGTTAIAGKYIRPNWAPPAAIRRDSPGLPAVIPGGSPDNPMGAAALTLSGGDYAIHGTNRPDSIGGFVSYGCIRMSNADMVDLFDRVDLGTPVIVTR